MKFSTKLAIVITTCSIAVPGCGARSSDKPTLPNKEANTSSVSSEPAPNAVTNDPNASITGSSPKAEVDAKDFGTAKSETSISRSEVASRVQTVPSTAIEAIALVNLLELPRLNEKSVQELESGATYLYYSGSGTLTEADTFYKKLLESRGWKEIPPLTPPTEQYIDRLFEKMGYYLRASLSLGSERGQLGIMLSNLGNVDVRSLPKLDDADAGQTPSTPVNVTYKSGSSIPDAADALLQKLTANGWQRWNEYQQTPVDVPHYRDLHFRKEACRLNVGIIRNPQDPADKTTIFYHAESVTPFDIPTTDPTQPIRLNLTSRRASFESTNSRADLVSLLKASSKKFGWEIGQTEQFEAGEEHRLPIHVNSGAYVVASLVESGGKYYGSIESFASAPKKQEPGSELTANSESSTSNEPMPVVKDTSFNESRALIDSSIQSEISKALGSIQSPGSAPKDLAALEAMAKELTKTLGSSAPTVKDNESEEEPARENPFDVPEDTSAPPAETRSINKAICKLKYKGKSYELDHAACYVVKESDGPTKCVIFSDSPIDVASLTRELLEEGKPVYGWYHSKNATRMLCFLIREYGVSIDATIGSMSMGISTTKIQPTLYYYQGKIAGKIVTTEPIEVGSEETIEFSAQLNQNVIQVDWAKRNSPESTKLIADTSKEYLLPEGCNNFSSEGSRYSKKIEATIKAPLASVQSFYAEQLEAKGWKETGDTANGFKKYRTNEQEMVLQLESITDACKIEMQVRNAAAAKADAMLPPAGKAMLVLGNLSDSTAQMTIAGKTYQVSPTDGQNPKDATKVIVEPGSIKVQVTMENGVKKFDMKVDASANSTWGVLFDTSFQDVMRLF